MVPAGFPALAPGGWKDTTRGIVAKAASDLTTEPLLRRVLASPWLRDTQKPDLLWVLRDGRERIEAGRFDDKGNGTSPRLPRTGQTQTLAGIDCSALPGTVFVRLCRDVMPYGDVSKRRMVMEALEQQRQEASHG